MLTVVIVTVLSYAAARRSAAGPASGIPVAFQDDSWHAHLGNQ
jgi:hypothetical protein